MNNISFSFFNVELMRYSAGGVNTIQNGAGSARSVVARLLTLTVITIFCCFLCVITPLTGVICIIFAILLQVSVIAEG